jgi:putative transposase
MPFDRFQYHRKSTRKPGWDYTRPGRYFITIWVKGGLSYFGKIVNNKVILSKYGKIVEQKWLEIEKKRENIKLDEFIVMPNHLHGIIIITHRIKSVNTSQTDNSYNTRSGRLFRLKANSIGSITGQFKSNCKKKIEKLLQYESMDTPYFSWHRNYHDHIIRSENELKNIRKYILNNSKNWDDDKFNPINFKE